MSGVTGGVQGIRSSHTGATGVSETWTTKKNRGTKGPMNVLNKEVK